MPGNPDGRPYGGDTHASHDVRPHCADTPYYAALNVPVLRTTVGAPAYLLNS